MHAQDVAEHELAPRSREPWRRPPRHPRRVVASGFSRNTWQPASMARMAKAAWRVGVGIDRDRIGPGLAQRLIVVLEQRIAPQLWRQSVRRRPDGAARQADDLEAVEPVVGEGMAAAHVAEADDQDADGVGHRALPGQRAAQRLRVGAEGMGEGERLGGWAALGKLVESTLGLGRASGGGRRAPTRAQSADRRASRTIRARRRRNAMCSLRNTNARRDSMSSHTVMLAMISSPNGWSSPVALPLSSCSRQTKPGLASPSALIRARLAMNSAMIG